MGSVCGSTLSLLDAGVPIKRPVSGIAMGLVKEEDGFAILSDIQGMEDALGDMDFKVAGTRNGVTALQMDIKIAGVSREILEAAAQANAGRMFIMDRMMEAISTPGEIVPFALELSALTLSPTKSGGNWPGGKMIKKIIDQTGFRLILKMMAGFHRWPIRSR